MTYEDWWEKNEIHIKGLEAGYDWNTPDEEDEEEEDEDIG